MKELNDPPKAFHQAYGSLIIRKVSIEEYYDLMNRTWEKVKEQQYDPRKPKLHR